MNSTYGWLYQKYAYPLLEKQREKAREEMKALCRECGLDPEQQRFPSGSILAYSLYPIHSFRN